ncbi:uncharacterized protein LOC143344179 [Colletes latitarsis]|uniref:uncharacterized protein LOC143344179 n=1 Tax=Colletes latitarsis TaxID=2605962 RepID=UPI0040352832
MSLKTILLLLFLAFLRSSISERFDRKDSAPSLADVQKGSNRGLVLVNPKQVQPLEKTLRRFLTKIAEPVKRPIILTRRFKEDDVQSTIREMCDSVRKRLMQFAKDCGLRTTVRRYEQASNNVSLSEDWFSETLLQGAYLLRDLGNMINEIEGEIDLLAGKPNATTQGSKELTQQDGSFQFLGVVYDAADFGDRLSQCLLQLSKGGFRRSFVLNRAILNLTRHPPDVVVRTLRSSAGGALLDDQNRRRRGSWRVALCFSIMKTEGIPFEDCMRNVQDLERCLYSMRQQSKEDVEGKSWMKAIQRLSDCKIHSDEQGKVMVSCKTSRGTPRTAKQKMKYVFERILDKKIPKRSPLHRAADDLGDTLSGSQLGLKFVDELYQCFGIYDEGLKKLKRLSTAGAKDKTAAARYKEVSKALRMYKNGVFVRTFGAIGKMHRSATEFEKILINGIKVTFNETWQSHVRIFSSMMEWMNKLLELHGGANSENIQSSPDASTAVEASNENEDSNMEDSSESGWRHVAVTRSKAEVMKEVDASVNDLMASMNRVSRLRSTNDKSMLACLANNLLLVTMFMETMGFVSTLFCFGQHTNGGQSSMEFDDEWRRTRRSLPFVENQDFDPIVEDFLVLQFYENVTSNVRKN